MILVWIIAGMTQAALIALVSIVAKRPSRVPVVMRIRSRRGPWRTG
jgi:hypothetical protein